MPFYTDIDAQKPYIYPQLRGTEATPSRLALRHQSHAFFTGTEVASLIFLDLSTAHLLI